MFRGLHEHTIDSKGRTHVPARFREVLLQQTPQDMPEQLIITTGVDPCLAAYTPEAWSEFEAKLASLSQFDPAVVQLKRIYVAGASECDIDKHGRILIPPVLRQYARLDRDVIWAGMVTTLELWSKQAWDARMLAGREDRSALARSMMELGL